MKALGTMCLIGGLSLLSVPVQAAEDLDLQIGGYMIQWVVAADNGSKGGSTDYAEVDEKSTSEVHFTASTTLDNGLGISARVELEAEAPNGAVGRLIDSSYLELDSGVVGNLQLGAIDDPTKLYRHGANDVGLGIRAGDHMAVVAPPANVNAIAVAHFQGGGTINKINYRTPSVGGLSLVGSYTPDASAVADSQAQPQARGQARTAYVAQILYEQTLAGVGIGIDAGYGKSHRGTTVSGQHAWQAGFELSLGGFKGGAEFLRHMEDGRSLVATGSNDGHAYDVGVSYVAAPWAASLSWLYSETEGSLFDTGTDTQRLVQASLNYTVGPGVDLTSTVLWADYDDEGTAAVDHNRGWGALAGVILVF